MSLFNFVHGIDARFLQPEIFPLKIPRPRHANLVNMYIECFLLLKIALFSLFHCKAGEEDNGVLGTALINTGTISRKQGSYSLVPRSSRRGLSTFHVYEHQIWCGSNSRMLHLHG